jgi:hypothetical protein
MAGQKKRGPHLVFVDGIWVTAEIAYLREMGERAYLKQTTPAIRPVDHGVQLPLVDVPKGKKPTAEELYARERAGT